jgi:hypothetical protein
MKDLHLHWGLGIGVVYGLFAGATMAFVMFAVTMPVELVSPDYYTRSLTYDQRLAAVRHADALGDALTMTHPVGSAELIVRLPRGQARSAVGTLTLYRPSSVDADRAIPLAVDALGEQRVSLRGFARGRWVVKTAWEAQGVRYYREFPVALP